MESEDEYIGQYLEDNNRDENTKARLFVVSSIDETIKIHINALELKDWCIDQLIAELNQNDNEQGIQEIIDVSKLTKGLRWDKSAMNQDIKSRSWYFATQFKLCWRLEHFECAWRRNKTWLWRWVVWTEKQKEGWKAFYWSNSIY